jgi:hypothetical protein
VLACAAVIGRPTCSSEAASQSIQRRTFPSPEDAVTTLVETVKKGDVDACSLSSAPTARTCWRRPIRRLPA